MLIDNLEIADEVEIRDSVRQEELVGLYSSALVTVLTSPSEGFGLSVFESLASGTPFIGTPVGAIPELAEKSKAGVLVPIGDPKILARTIAGVLENQDMWSEMSTNGRKFVTNFSWDIVTRMYFEFYEDLIG
jgi:glycosyltransferase involved in cell wall biosynthesis